MIKERGKILVIGGGISGITTALEASEIGQDVVLVEKSQLWEAGFLGSISISLNYVLLPVAWKLITDVCGQIRIFKSTQIQKSFLYPETQEISRSRSVRIPPL
ncbi:MAG: hypothetical protein CM1200mP30_18060 [Pseudomonadota bacterium]|nr:MAG: hypothetical protein CM1200mP30_18060 [Pseudomonadota bacterium]